ncbi:cutinase gene palindrome-binding protein [Cladorrhinum sp. PSN332]|nr:cutinase gene palindrome-binding protein [Cladorrhinum sp. PSN332]
MSHGHPMSNANYFGYGTETVGDPFFMNPDPNDMMSMLDASMFSSFDDPNMMTLDGNDPLAPQYATAPPSAQQRRTLPSVPSVSTSNTGPSNANAAAAGPSPVTALTPSTSSSANALTEFTKRRNWPAKVVEELKDFLHILDSHGRIKHVSPSVEALTGYKPSDLQDLFLRDLLHPDDVGLFNSEFNESIADGSQLRLFYRIRKADGKYSVFEAVGHAHIAAAKFAPNPNNQSPFCQAVFMMSRPYPTKNARFLDSFLEHKIENERLRRRISELRREEKDENDESQRTWPLSQEARSDIAPSDDAMRSSSLANMYPNATSMDLSMPPPDRPSSSAHNGALTRENLENVTGARPDSIRDKMARYEGSTHADTIEMLTGLRYQEGERSRGITTGNASPILVKGDAGIDIPLDRDGRLGERDKKKKQKVAEEYVCTDCGTLESPEWRKGPQGPKTLCNACGLRWAKQEKKNKTKHNSAYNAGGMAEKGSNDNTG